MIDQSKPQLPLGAQDGGGISMQSLQREIEQLRQEIEKIKRVMNEQNDPGRVGKPGLF